MAKTDNDRRNTKEEGLGPVLEEFSGDREREVVSGGKEGEVCSDALGEVALVVGRADNHIGFKLDAVPQCSIVVTCGRVLVSPCSLLDQSRGRERTPHAVHLAANNKPNTGERRFNDDAPLVIRVNVAREAWGGCTGILGLGSRRRRRRGRWRLGAVRFKCVPVGNVPVSASKQSVERVLRTRMCSPIVREQLGLRVGSVPATLQSD